MTFTIQSSWMWISPRYGVINLILILIHPLSPSQVPVCTQIGARNDGLSSTKTDVSIYLHQFMVICLFTHLPKDRSMWAGNLHKKSVNK